MRDINIVIVNFRTADLTIDCLRSLSLEVAALSDVRATVVDGGSADGSADRLVEAVHRNNWSDWVTVLALERNDGFAYANNQAIKPLLASSEPPAYVLLLNPDTIVRPGAIARLIEFMQSRREVGIAGSRLEHLDGTAQHSAFRFHSVLSELEKGLRLGIASALLRRWVTALPVSEKPCQVDWVSGACMIIRREVLDQVGLLDEAYFMYYEEVDFCRRAADAGWPCWYVPEARVVHLVGQSSGVDRPRVPPQRRPTYWFDSRRRYLRTHLGPLRAFIADLLWATGYASFRVRALLQRKPVQDPPMLFWDFVRHAFIPGMNRTSQTPGTGSS